LAGTHAFYLLLAVILIFGLIIYKRFKSNLLPGILLWIWIVGILFSLMRHLWLALILGVILLFILIPKKFKKSFKIYTIKNGLIILSLILVYVLVVNLYPYQSFESRLFRSTENIQTRVVSITKTAVDTSINWRISLWSSAAKTWVKNPVIGVGFGREIFLEVGDWRTYEEIRNLHNSSLAILAQMGILGLALFYGFSVSVIWLSRKYLWLDEKLSPYYISLAVCAVLFVFVSFFQPYFETNLFAIFFWIIMGLLRSGELIFKNKNKI
jgi:O-antigen ligase